MEEAVDQETTIVYPERGAPVIVRAHEQLARTGEEKAVCTVPLAADGQLTGALTLERSSDELLDVARHGQSEQPEVLPDRGQVEPLHALALQTTIPENA